MTNFKIFEKKHKKCNLIALIYIEAYMIKFTDIIQLIKDKDDSSIIVLYENYGRRFYNYCVKNWECDEDTAWEIVYRTLETLILKLDLYSFATQKKFDGFLFTVLTNYIRQEFRSARIKNGVQFSVTDFNDESLPKEIDEKITLKALDKFYQDDEIESIVMIQLKECLVQMDEEDRDVLLLRAQGYSYEEIERLLKITDPNLKVKYLRAKKKLIKLLAEKHK